MHLWQLIDLGRCVFVRQLVPDIVSSFVIVLRQ